MSLFQADHAAHGEYGRPGWQTARVLAVHGARVVLTGRDPGNLTAAAEAIRTEIPATAVDTLVLDLGNLKSISAAAARVVDGGPLDLLINNAGVMNIADGFEMTFGINHLGHLALTAQLMPALRAASAARVVTVSAIAARWGSGETDRPDERAEVPADGRLREIQAGQHRVHRRTRPPVRDRCRVPVSP